MKYVVITLTDGEWQRVQSVNRITMAVTWAQVGAEHYDRCFVYDMERHTVVAEVTTKTVLVY